MFQTPIKNRRSFLHKLLAFKNFCGYKWNTHYVHYELYVVFTVALDFAKKLLLWLRKKKVWSVTGLETQFEWL